MHRRFWSSLLIALLVVAPASARPPEDLYIRDTTADNGAEPSSGIPYLSPDIWVRRTPDPNYQPHPFTTPTWTPLPHENPEYRDPKRSTPNWVYVRITNGGTTASSGTERLRLYWAKASTGLGWPGQWDDSLASNCGPQKAYGMEITKPRKNAAAATQTERDRYRDAVLAIATTPAFQLGNFSYFHRQNGVHSSTAMHHNLGFLAWHREFINRYEVLLQEADPRVKLLYWDWTKDPETGGFHFFTPQFMGASGRGSNAPVSIGAPFLPALSTTPSAVTRRLQNGLPPALPDATILAPTAFTPFAGVHSFPFSGLEYDAHDVSHGYLGGGMASTAVAARDPMFFVLHANADRLWAEWQNADVSRRVPQTAYGTVNDQNLTNNMLPWSGGTQLTPWQTGSSELVPKNARHESIVTPPFYDKPPAIPALQPGQSVILQIPWYPPNPADYACESEQDHFCLLARIETTETSPFGMSVAETISVGDNTRKNNNIAWKNVTVVPFSGLRNVTTVLMRNIYDQPVAAALQFADAPGSESFFKQGKIVVDLGPELYSRWVAGGRVGSNVEPVVSRRRVVRSEAAGAAPAAGVRVTGPNAFLGNLRLERNEVFPLDVHFDLDRDYTPAAGVVPRWDVIQTGAPGDPQAFVGGQRFEMVLDEIVLVKGGAKWRYRDDGSDPGRFWTAIDYDDSTWKSGKAPFGVGERQETTIDGRPVTTYYRHTYELRDPYYLQTLLLRLRRDDGAVVYLNGAEIHRSNMPEGLVLPDTVAVTEVAGAEEEAYFPIPLTRDLLHSGKNVIAVELHQRTARGEDATFDLELTGNRASSKFAPYAVFTGPDDAAIRLLGARERIAVDALDVDGRVRSVSVYAGNALIGTLTRPPYVFDWTPSPVGAQRLRAEVVDDDGQTTVVTRTIMVDRNVPPRVTLTAPADGATFPGSGAITAEATASDENGTIDRVEFYLRDADLFAARPQLVGRATSPPYRVQFFAPNLPHLMLWAVAVDDQGATTQSLQIHLTLHQH